MAELTAVAFMIQIADIGIRLSLKLFTFAQTVANADEAILSTSKDVSLTCSVLKEVGEVLKADVSSRTYSASAVGTATTIVTECSDVFEEMERILVEKVPNIMSNCRHKILTTLALKPWEQFKWSYWQPKLQLLRSNLDRLRSTLSVMLHVITYQRILNTATPDVRANQTALIRELIRSKEKQVEKYEKLKRSLTDAEDPVFGSLAILDTPSPVRVRHSKAREKFFARTLQEKRRRKPSSLAEFTREEETELAYASHLSDLFGRLITEVDIEEYRIGLLSRHRIRLYLHKPQSREFEQLIHLYGATALEQIYGLQSPREDARLATSVRWQSENPDRKLRRVKGKSFINIHNNQSDTRESLLQEFWLSPDGISRDVLEDSISEMLGPEAFFKSAFYDGVEGYCVTASKPLTSQQLQDLLKRSRSNISQEPRLTNLDRHPGSRDKTRANDPRFVRDRDDLDRDRKRIQDWSRSIAITPDETETARSSSRRRLKGKGKWFIDGDGIHPEVMEREICKFLGPEASFEPATYNDVIGYDVDAYRPFTPAMLEDLHALSEEYTRETREKVSSGYQGIPYREAQTSRRLSQDYALLEPPVKDPSASRKMRRRTSASRSRSASSTSYDPDSTKNPSSANNHEHNPGYPPSRDLAFPAASSYSPAGNRTIQGESVGLDEQNNAHPCRAAYYDRQSSPMEHDDFYPNASEPHESMIAKAQSMSTGNMTIQSLIEEPQANLNSTSYNDDGDSERSRILSSDEDMIQQSIPRDVPNHKRLRSPSLDEISPAPKRRRYESNTDDPKTMEASGDGTTSPLPPMELHQTPNPNPQPAFGGLSDTKNGEDEISKALLDLVELWTPLD